MSAEEHAYVGTKPCGCVTLIVMERHKIAGREVARAIKAGDAINRMTVEAVRQLPSLRCPEHPRSARVGVTATQGGLL